MKTNLRKPRLHALLRLGTLILLAACGQPATQVQEETKQPLTIGATLDLSGPNAVYGEQVKAGIDLALEEINLAGGVNGAPIKVLYQDSRSDAKTAVSNAQRFISVDGCTILMGEISSTEEYKVIRRLNYVGQEVDEFYHGFFIEHRDHGKPVMRFQ